MNDNTHDFNGPAAREKCNYYNRTRNRLLITAYEGIPENLLLNAVGCLVSINNIHNTYIALYYKLKYIIYVSALSFIFCIHEKESMGLWSFSTSQ